MNFSVSASFQDDTIVSCRFTIKTETKNKIMVIISFPINDIGIQDEEPVFIAKIEHYKKMLELKSKLEKKL